VAWLVTAASLLTLLGPPPQAIPRGTLLEYRRPLGQVAEYELRFRARGEQISLGERRPVYVDGAVAVTEEVVAHEPDGIVRLRVSGRLLEARDPTGAFSAGHARRWPELQLRVTPTGEVLETSIRAPAGPDPLPRAFGSLLGQPLPIVLPQRPVEPGQQWRYAAGRALQTNRLLEITDGADLIARIESESTAPLTLCEGSAALGLTFTLSGEQRQSSRLELPLRLGLPVRHEGRLLVRSQAQAELALPEGVETFEFTSDLTVDFEVRLVRLDGAPLPGR